MNRLERKLQKQAEANQRKEMEQKKFEADIKKKAEICRKFVNDKKYADFKELFTSLIKQKQEEMSSLPFSAKTNDEILRRSLIIQTEINTIVKIFETPQQFFDMEKEIKGEDK